MSVCCCVAMFVLLRAGVPLLIYVVFFLMIRRPPRSTLDRSSAASDVYKRQIVVNRSAHCLTNGTRWITICQTEAFLAIADARSQLSLIHISEPTRPY